MSKKDSDRWKREHKICKILYGEIEQKSAKRVDSLENSSGFPLFFFTGETIPHLYNI